MIIPMTTRPDLRGAILAAGRAKHGDTAGLIRAMAERWGVSPDTAKARIYRMLHSARPPEHVTQIEDMLAEVGLTVAPAVEPDEIDSAPSLSA